MKDEDIGVVQQRAKELFLGEQPRYISDNGKQFTSREFKHFIEENDLTHVTTSPYYPQSNGKLERYHKSIKSECIRVKCPLSLEEAKKVIGGYVKHYNEERLHSAIEYVTPKTKLEGREREIITKRDRKLEK
ncbi:integrase core domain-containing protein, partial [Chitinivibrio alkaliphilus]|uniref:integrase core domain-containing protein n=1 Tax=Chitinivibrio alkaliphilus TaxID=1505232 RepID=UPI001EFA064E